MFPVLNVLWPRVVNLVASTPIGETHLEFGMIGVWVSVFRYTFLIAYTFLLTGVGLIRIYLGSIKKGSSSVLFRNGSFVSSVSSCFDASDSSLLDILKFDSRTLLAR